MTLRRLIPYSSALAMLAIGCNDASTPIGLLQDVVSDGTSTDTGSTDTDSDGGTDTLEDTSVLDVVIRPDSGTADSGTTDSGTTDSGTTDVVTRPDTGPEDTSGDTGSPTISDATREAARQVCEQFEECGLGSARECAADIADSLFDYAYRAADDFEACDAALGRFLTCVDVELQQECDQEAQYNCEREQQDIAYECGLYDGY
jgi:hypothetical protein